MGPEHRATTSVVIAVLTFRREEQLAELLPELARQAALQGPPARVVVVDNDPAGGAEGAVRSLHLDVVSYVHEPAPGIAAARNAALDAAAGADAIVFIDDDETPDPGWLAALVDAHRRLGGSAIAGPVLRVHEHEPVPWVRAARVMDDRRYPTGTSLEAAGTGNLLVDLSHVRRHDLRFDDRLGLAGGSDHLFTKRIRRTGGTIHWCDEAVVHEFVPAERLRGGWVLRRHYRSASTTTRVDLMLADSVAGRARVRIESMARAVALVGLGLVHVVAGTVARDARRQGLGAWRVARGVGFAGGTLGRWYVEYDRGALR